MAARAPRSRPIRARRRAAAIAAMADHVLTEGLAGATLRALAQAAGTSDRMLLYHFASKEEILAETLAAIAARLTGALEATLPAGVPLPAADLTRQLAAAVAAPDLKPFMALWLELAAAAARGEEPHRSIAGAIADGFLAFIAARLPEGPAQAAQAARVLATVEGLALLDALGRPALSGLVLAQAPE